MAFGLIIQRRSQVPSGGWPEWIGIPGRNESEQVAGINRNQWPECAGISLAGSALGGLLGPSYWN
jgi:hypothetical protein